MINSNMLSFGKERSAIRELFEKGKELKQKYGDENVYDFSIGNPNILPPRELSDTVKNLFMVSKIVDVKGKNDVDVEIESPNPNYQYRKLSTNDLHGYTSAQGDEEVRKAIADYLNEKFSVSLDKNLIYMTCGAAAGLAISLKALISSHNDEVIVFAPYFPEYKVFIENAGGKCVPCIPNFNNFYPDLVDLDEIINENTRAVIINSPNNPTGVVLDDKIVTKISEILDKKQKEFNHPIYIISDEPYRELIYNDKKQFTFFTKFYDNCIINYSFSKVISIPGERIGYVAVNPKAENANDLYYAICGAARASGYVCAPSLFQFIIPHIINQKSDLNIYKNNVKYLYEELSNIGYECVYPDGAFYLFVKALCPDDKEFSKKALDYNLLIVPSTSFGVTGYFRISYCVKEEVIKNSLAKFRELYEYYTNR